MNEENSIGFRRDKMGKYTHIDCFSGPGGICTGLHAAGFETVIAIEYIQSCCETYSKNHPQVHVINDDIRSVTYEDIAPFIPDNGVDLVTSGMPCETFSTAGNKSRSFYDDRQFLFREGIRIAQLAKAKILALWEHGNQKTGTSIYYSITLFLYANTGRSCLHQNRYQMI